MGTKTFFTNNMSDFCLNFNKEKVLKQELTCNNVKILVNLLVLVILCKSFQISNLVSSCLGLQKKFFKRDVPSWVKKTGLVLPSWVIKS